MPDSFNMSYHIAQAQIGQLTEVVSLLREAAAWLKSTGKEMWQADDFTDEKIKPGIEAGQYWIASQDQIYVGVTRFQLDDPLFWPELSGHDSAFIHRLAVRRQSAGQGVSVALLRFAREHARSLGKSYLRLDCAADRTSLRQFYERNGFTFHSYLHVAGWHLARYEMCIHE